MLLRRDGVPIWISINHGPWNSDDGRYLGLVFFVTDVTNRRRLHDELQRREDQLARTQRAAGLGSWEWDIPPSEVRWSDELYRILGLRPSELEASFEGYLGMIHPDDRQVNLDAVERCLSGEPGFEFEQRVVRRDGTTVWVRSVRGAATRGGRTACADAGLSLENRPLQGGGGQAATNHRSLPAPADHGLGRQWGERAGGGRGAGRAGAVRPPGLAGRPRVRGLRRPTAAAVAG